MERYGDNIHVLRLIDSIEDETNIYIVMPYCALLLDSIQEGEGLPEAEAREWFQQILENLQYLRAHRMCHRDLSPAHCMMYQGRVVFSLSGVSFQLPPNELHANGKVGRGNPKYQPPEVQLGERYNAYGCDLWSAVVILFNLLTGHILYHHPHPVDFKFRYFILSRGISMTPRQDLMNEIWIGLNESQRLEFLSIIARHSELSPEAKEIFGGVLRMDERWDLDAVAAHLPLWI